MLLRFPKSLAVVLILGVLHSIAQTSTPTTTTPDSGVGQAATDSSQCKPAIAGTFHVTVSVHIDRTARPSRVGLHKSSGDACLDSKALKAVLTYNWQTNKGLTVPEDLLIVVNFRVLSDGTVQPQ